MEAAIPLTIKEKTNKVMGINPKDARFTKPI